LDCIETAKQLVAGFDTLRLGQLKRRWGRTERKVGTTAGRILMYAEILVSGKERVLGPAAIPAHHNFVMFDPRRNAAAPRRA